METFTTPTHDRSVQLVISITLVLALIISVSGAGGMTASLVLCATCAGLARLKEAGPFWTWFPATLGALSAIALVGHVG